MTEQQRTRTESITMVKISSLGTTGSAVKAGECTPVVDDEPAPMTSEPQLTVPAFFAVRCVGSVDDGTLVLPTRTLLAMV